MAQDIQIAGATFNAVPSIVVPVAGGGSATFIDPSPTTATAADVANGKLFFDALGVLTQGTASGSGGGLEYEEGTFTPTSDVDHPTISFQNQHSSAPIFYAIADVSDATGLTANSNTFCCFVYTRELFGSAVPYNATGSYFRYAHGTYNYINSNSATQQNGFNCSKYGTADDGSANNMPSWWATSTAIKPSSSSTTRYWRSGRTYKWIAVWKPAT